MPLLETIGSTHSLHIWLGIFLATKIFLDEYDPSGRVFHSPQTRSVCCGIIICTIVVTYFGNPARRLTMDEEDDGDEFNSSGGSRRRSSWLGKLSESASNTISSSSSSMFRNALFFACIFWFSWPSGRNGSMSYVAADDVCDADDMSCRIANHYGPPICCLNPSFCDSGHTHTWIYSEGGTAQAYKQNAPIKKTICEAESIRETKMRHKVATWPYSRSNRKVLPELKIKLNLLLCSDGQKPNQPPANEEATEEGSVPADQDSNCCCHPLLAGSGANATIEIWQTRPDGTYSSLRQGNEEGDCRAKWIVTGSEEDATQGLFGSDSIPQAVEFTTMAPGSTGSLGGLGPNHWEFSPYGPPAVHILVRPGMDGVRPLLVDVPVSMHHKTLQQREFTWRDWRGPSWVKSKGNPDQPSFNITSWEEDLETLSVSMGVDLFLREDKEFSAAYTSTTSNLMCPSLFYGLPSSFFLEPISMCGRYMLDYFDL